MQNKQSENASEKANLVWGSIVNHLIFGMGVPILVVLLGKRVDKKTGWRKILPTPWNIVLAIPLAFTGAFFRGWSDYYLMNVGKGHAFSSPEHGLPAPTNMVTEGPYRLCRNPMMSGTFMINFSSSLGFNSPGSLFLASPLYMLIDNLLVRRKEEPYLEEKFGEAFTDYMREVPRFLPRLRRQGN